jgi:transposase
MIAPLVRRSSAGYPVWVAPIARAYSGRGAIPGGPENRRRQAGRHVGLDVSLEETVICVIDDAGTIVREGKAESEPAAIVTWLKSIDVAIERLGLEAGPLSPWRCGELQAAALPAVCIETRRMKGATAAMGVKTDRNDARAIAQAMRVGWSTAVHVKTMESHELRLLLTNRKMLLTTRSKPSASRSVATAPAHLLDI